MHLVQQFSDRVGIASRVIERMASDSSVNIQFASHVHKGSRAPRVLSFKEAVGNGRPIKLISSDGDSRAWQDFIGELSNDHAVKGLKELSLSVGCAAAGDIQGALEHGMYATGEAAQGIWDTFTGRAIGGWNGGVDRQ